jgi:hypothetical protein
MRSKRSLSVAWIALLVGAGALAPACRFTIEGQSLAPLDGAVPDDAAMPADLTPATLRDLANALPANIGDACAGQCATGLTCMSWVPAGYCSRPCDNMTNPCPSGSSCADIGAGTRVCLLDEHGSCARPDLTCRDCGPTVCAPPSFCGGC